MPMNLRSARRTKALAARKIKARRFPFDIKLSWRILSDIRIFQKRGMQSMISLRRVTRRSVTLAGALVTLAGRRLAHRRLSFHLLRGTADH